MEKEQEKNNEIEKIKKLVNEGRLDDAVDAISKYLIDTDKKEDLNRLEEILEAILTIHGGKTVLRFLIEQKIIDVPSLLQNLSKRDSMLRYSFLLLLKPIVEVESDLFLPHIENLLKSEDPNVKEAALQLVIFITGGDKEITDENKIQAIASKLSNEKDFVTEKAIQALKSIGGKKPSIITKILTNYAEQYLEDEKLKKNIDEIIKSIVSIEKIDEIVIEKTIEEEKPTEKITEEELLEKKKQEILNKEKELEERDLELKRKKLEIEEKEKELEEKEIQQKREALERREQLLEMKKQLIQVELELKEKELTEKELELKKKEAERIKEKIDELGEQNTTSS